MRLTAHERAARREALRRMTAPEKLDYIFSYYKLPIILILLFIYVLCYGAYRHFSRKQVLLYAACINVAVGTDTDAVLSNGFVRFCGGETRKEEVYVYHNLYLSDNPAPANHEYAYASRLKLMAAVDAEQLDVVFMNREAYDLLSANGYLTDLPSVLSRYQPKFYGTILSFLTENEIILEDNAIEHNLNETEEYQAVTESQVNGVEITGFPVFQNLGFTEQVFCGIIRNSPRLDSAAGYIAYLASSTPS